MKITWDLGKDITYEVLIENLGGYEQAKNHRDYLIDFGDEFNRPNKYEVDKINSALLQYRREHGIYEVGDPLVSRCNNEFRLFTYEAISGKNITVKCKKGKAYCYPKKWFQHATDAEIKANKRLEVG